MVFCVWALCEDMRTNSLALVSRLSSTVSALPLDIALGSSQFVGAAPRFSARECTLALSTTVER